MSQAIERYLDRVMAYADLRDADEAASRRAEQADHLNEKIERLVADGSPREDAIFAAIEDHGPPSVVGYGLRRWRWVDVRARGTARGVIAIGPKAVGIFAFGGAAFGILAIGGLSCGVISFGGLSLALLFCWAGVGAAPLGIAYAGLAFGLVAMGGLACGAVAEGGTAIGLWAHGTQSLSYYNQDSVPQLLSLLQPSRYVDKQFIFLFTVSLVISYIPLLALPLWASRRETQRMKQSDPWLVE